MPPATSWKCASGATHEMEQAQKALLLVPLLLAIQRPTGIMRHQSIATSRGLPLKVLQSVCASTMYYITGTVGNNASVSGTITFSSVRVVSAVNFTADGFLFNSLPASSASPGPELNYYTQEFASGINYFDLVYTPSFKLCTAGTGATCASNTGGPNRRGDPFVRLLPRHFDGRCKRDADSRRLRRQRRPYPRRPSLMLLATGLAACAGTALRRLRR